MMKPRNSTYHSGLAAEYLVASCLVRLKLETYITTGNFKKTDIRVVHPDTNKTCTVDVKSVRGYSSLVVNNVKPTPGHFLVCVVFNNKLESPEIMPDIYIIPSEEIPTVVQYFKKEARLMKNSIERFKSQWSLILDYVS